MTYIIVRLTAKGCQLVLCETLKLMQINYKKLLIKSQNLVLYSHLQRNWYKLIRVFTIIVSKMTSHCAGAVQMREESERGIRKWEEMWFKTTAEDGERERTAVTCDGRLFHRRAAATRNALLPTVDRRVRRTSRDVDEAERSRRLALMSAGRRISKKSPGFWALYLAIEDIEVYIEDKDI